MLIVSNNMSSVCFWWIVRDTVKTFS